MLSFAPKYLLHSFYKTWNNQFRLWMEKADKFTIYQRFINTEDERGRLQLTGFLESFLDYAEYTIKSEFDKGGKKLIKHKKKKDVFKQRFLEAYNAQSASEKIQQYIRIVMYIKQLKQGILEPDSVQGQRVFSEAYCLSYNLHLWKRKQLKLDLTRGQIFCLKDSKIKFYDLNNYLVRQSKNTDYSCFVLEAINTIPHHKSLVVRIGFKDANTFHECLKLVKETVIKMERQRIREQLGIKLPLDHAGDTSKTLPVVHYQKSQSISSGKSKPVNKDQDQYQEHSFKSQIGGDANNREDGREDQIQTIAQSLLQTDNSDEMYTIQEKESQNEVQDKKNLDVFHQIVPDYQLETILSQGGYSLIHSQGQGRIYHHNQDNQKYKVKITVPEASQTLIFQGLVRVENYTKWNDAIWEVMIKSVLKSENVVVMYQKHKAISKIYRARDFVIMRHVFRKGEDLYFVDKSIQNASYPPFITIVRGQLQIVWGIIKKWDSYEVVAQIDVENGGYLNEGQNHNLTMLYLKGLMGLEDYLKDTDNVQCQWDVFDLTWDINKNEKNKQIEQKRRKNKQIQNLSALHKPETFKKSKHPQPSQKSQAKQELKSAQPVSPEPRLNKEPFPSETKIQTPKQGLQAFKEVTDDDDLCREAQLSIKYNFDQNGRIIVPLGYLKPKYQLEPEPTKPIRFQQVIAGSAIWKGEWKFDKKEGGIIYINQQTINDQKGVIKFILSKIAKNLLSGKSVLQISLPVDIFGYESNLQRLAFGMTYAPIILQKAAIEKDPVERLKMVTAFGLTNSSLYLSMEKPFNSIIGETFQGWMNGCPVYMQQISHHPPIAAFLLIGRGYKMTGSLESKVQVHMNSGCGTNQGVYRVVMEDGSDFNFITPGGQIQGISYGDRKFNLVGKYYIWSKKHALFLEVVMDPSKKGMFSKRQHPTDYMEGDLKQVTPEFISRFESQKRKQKEGPSKQQTVKVICKANGTWWSNLMFDGKVYLNLDQEVGCKLQYDKRLLPSDGNWRQDLAYRRLKDITRAQTEKERLEISQRADKKLREKSGKSKH